MKLKILTLSLLFALALASCGKDDDSCDSTDITYNTGVSDIINASCAVAGCHVVGNEANAFFSLEGYASAKASADFGRIVGTITHAEGFSPMPKGQDKLEDCDIEKLTAWIDAGAPE